MYRSVSMLKMNGTACIEAAPEQVWQVLADVENISLWSEAVVSAEICSQTQTGVGLERVCRLQNGITITERWTEWEKGRSFTYEGFNLPLVKSAKNTWSLRGENGKTLLETQSEVVIKGGLLGRILEPLMKIMASKMGGDALAAFKYLVEHGEPFQGKHSILPRVPVNC